jgi:hypothetical protein
MRILPSFVALAMFAFAPGCASDTDADDPTVDVGEDPPLDEPPADPDPSDPERPPQTIENMIEQGRARGQIIAEALRVSTVGTDYRVQLGRGANTVVALHDAELQQIVFAVEGARTDGVRDFAASRIAMYDAAQAGLDQLIRDYSITLTPTWAVDLIEDEGATDLANLRASPPEQLDRDFLGLEIVILARDQVIATQLWSITGDTHPFGVFMRIVSNEIDRHLALAIDAYSRQYGD